MKFSLILIYQHLVKFSDVCVDDQHVAYIFSNYEIDWNENSCIITQIIKNFKIILLSQPTATKIGKMAHSKKMKHERCVQGNQIKEMKTKGVGIPAGFSRLVVPGKV